MNTDELQIGDYVIFFWDSHPDDKYIGRIVKFYYTRVFFGSKDYDTEIIDLSARSYQLSVKKRDLIKLNKKFMELLF